MFLGTISNWTSVVGSDVPFATKINSNNKITNNGGVLSLNKVGYWNIDVNLVVSGAVGDVTATLYEDGVASPTAFSTITLASGGTGTLNIPDAVRTTFAEFPQFGTISVRFSQPNVIANGQIRVEYVQ